VKWFYLRYFPSIETRSKKGASSLSDLERLSEGIRAESTISAAGRDKSDRLLETLKLKLSKNECFDERQDAGLLDTGGTVFIGTERSMATHFVCHLFRSGYFETLRVVRRVRSAQDRGVDPGLKVGRGRKGPNELFTSKMPKMGFSVNPFRAALRLFFAD